MVGQNRKTASEMLRDRYVELLRLRGLVQRLESASRKTTERNRRKAGRATIARDLNSPSVGSGLLH